MVNRTLGTPLDDGFNYAPAVRQSDIVYISAVSPRMQVDQLLFVVPYDHIRKSSA